MAPYNEGDAIDDGLKGRKVTAAPGNFSPRYIVEHGADILTAPVDQPYGVREYGARDIEGHLWYLHSSLE